MEKVNLKPGERLDQIAGSRVRIIQSREVFSFSIDAILLARFPRVPQKGVILDMCSGSGAVGLFLSQMTKASIVQIELQDRLSDMNARSVRINHLDNQIRVIHDDLKNSLDHVPVSSCDLVTCNPPYFKLNEGARVNRNQPYTLARHELATNLQEVCQVSNQVLKPGGHLALVHRPDRFLEIMDTLREHRLTPKIIQFVYPKREQPANILLVDAIKDGNSGGEIFLPPLVVHEPNGSYTPEIQEIYYGKKVT